MAKRSMGNWARFPCAFLLLVGITPLVRAQVLQEAVSVRLNPQQEVAGSGQPRVVFHKDVEEVVLHTSVSDERHRLVTDLNVRDFTVFENGVPQLIKSFTSEDMPVAMGIIIDSSASMLIKSRAVNQAALDLVRASNPKDEIFVAHFNQQYHLDQDFTSDISKLQSALERIRFQGETAIYDAIVAAATHLFGNENLDKRVLVIVTDGEDNFSSYSLSQAIERVQLEGGPMIYTIGILDPERTEDDEGRTDNAARALKELAAATGGVAYLPHHVREVDLISQKISHDVRNQFTITYKPSIPWSEAGYRQIKVQVKAPGRRKLIARTKNGYIANGEQASR